MIDNNYMNSNSFFGEEKKNIRYFVIQFLRLTHNVCILVWEYTFSIYLNKISQFPEGKKGSTIFLNFKEQR